MPPRALLFDFDGVIADTENHHIASWQRTFSSMGWEVPEELCLRAMEVDDRVFLAEVFQARGLERGDVEGWVRKKQVLTRAMLADSPRVFPEVKALVERVKALRTVKLAVVSTTWRENIVTVLQAAGLYQSFSLIVGKEDVAKTKPDPECYRRAVECLGVSARDAIALEDSPSGLNAARGAGVPVVAVGYRFGDGAWVGKSVFLADLRNTNAVLNALGL